MCVVLALNVSWCLVFEVEKYYGLSIQRYVLRAVSIEEVVSNKD